MELNLRILKNVKSVNILGHISENRVEPSVETILSWLDDYNAKWICEAGITDGFNAYLLYDRLVVFEATGISACSEDLAVLGRRVRELGLLFVWRVSIDDLVSFPVDLKSFVSDTGVSTIAVVMGDNIDARAYAVVVSLLESACNVQLVGKLDLLMKSGLLEETCFNNRHAEILNVDTESTSTIDLIANTRSCDGRLSLSISPSGHVYPCPYLLDAPPEFAISHLSGSFDDILTKQAHVLNSLIERGPAEMPAILKGKVEKTMPVECQFHLKRLSEARNNGKLSSAD